ncbi:MAG: selenium cofactor biosynthesis protein YqeC [Syntrophobacter sp.]
MHHLLKPFGLDENEYVLLCLVGGGGKTTTLFKLADCLKARGKRVLVTTTTAIFVPGAEQYDVLEVAEFPRFEGVAEGTVTVAGRGVNADGKLLGVDPDWVNAIYQEHIFDCVLVEGDGSKQRPIKAPEIHEPVIPSRTTHLVGVVGIDALGKAADERTVFRIDRFRAVTGLHSNGIIDADTVCRLVLSKAGIFKNTPENSRKILLLNKVDTEKDLHRARAVFRTVQDRMSDPIRLLAGSMQDGKVEEEPFSKVSGIIMASGYARRMNTQKLLMPVDGIPVLERVIRAAIASRLKETLVVYRDDSIRAIAEQYPVKALHNPNARLGQSESIKIGMSKADSEADGFMFLVGDQPFMRPEIIDNLIGLFETNPQRIVLPKYQDKRGNPVLFPVSLKGALTEIQGDNGGREVISHRCNLVYEHVIDDEKAGFDIDTLEDYALALKLARLL